MNITDERARENHLYDHPEEATPEDVRAMVSNLRAMRECAAEGPPSTVSEAGALERWERRA